MADLNQSLKEAVCIDEEVFFGPITDKERKIREHFEALHRNERNGLEASKNIEDDDSQNSVYKSFSIEESKYDSFDDSLNEGVDKMPQEAKCITLRKSYDKIKSKRFYDSLEDVHSLASNIDKCSISCEVENESNLNSKHYVDDSLQILSVPVASKNNFANDQVHFDDDSLAILECETTFSDSLEEANVLESIEIEEINDIDIENISIENQNVFTGNQHSTCPKNLFDTSVELFCEKKNSDTNDQEESIDEKNLLYDSLSNSDLKDILTDSLEEDQLKEMLSFSNRAAINVVYDKESTIERHNNELLNVEHNSLPNLFATSVQIVSDTHQNISDIVSKELLNNKNMSDSLSNSEIKDVSKDSLEESDKLNEILNISQRNDENNFTKSEDIYLPQNAEESITEKHNKELLNVKQNPVCPFLNLSDTSVQNICEKQKDSNVEESLNNKNNPDLLSNFEVKDASKDGLNKLHETLYISQQSSSNNFTKPEDVYSKQNDKESVIERHNDELLNIEQNSICPSPNILNDSVQIIGEKHKDSCDSNEKDSVNKNISYDSLSNSELKCVSKDSLEESDKQNEILTVSQLSSGNNITISDDTCQKSDILETSVQIIYDNASNYFEKVYTSKEDFENNKSFQETSTEQIKMEICSAQPSSSKKFCLSQNIFKISENVNPDSCIIENKIKPVISVSSDPATINSGNGISNITKDAFSVESCHLKILNDDVNIDKDLKFQLHMEVTVGDKKCQIASEDIKIIPVSSESCKSENDFISNASVSHSISSAALHTEKSDHVMHLNNQEINLKNKDCNVPRTHSPSDMNSSSHRMCETAFTRHITQRAKSSVSQASCVKLNCMDSFNDVSLLQALDLSDLSTSLNESVIQSKDSLMSLNLYSPDEYLQNFHIPQFKNKNKENIPEDMRRFEKQDFYARKKKSSSPNKVYNSETPQSLQKCPSFKEPNKKTPGTKIPIRKVDNFVVPSITPSKFAKPISATLSAEKVKKSQHSPHSVDCGKKTTPNKTPHICKVRNTIFSKVPQIIPSKKYMNVQSPVAQYINGPVKTPEPVLRDCMNHLMGSPHHLHHPHTNGSLKSLKKNA